MVDCYNQTQLNLADAMEKVSNLLESSVGDDVPAIQTANPSIQFESNIDTNFKDVYAFKYAESIGDAVTYSDFTEILEEGQKFVNMLYTWRSISRPISGDRLSDDQNRKEIHQRTIAILEPYAKQVNEFMKFQEFAINQFVTRYKNMNHKDKKVLFINQTYLVMMGKMLKMFAVLNDMKYMKASVLTDYSIYKRAIEALQGIGKAEEMSRVSMFMAEQNNIRNSLKKSLNEIPDYENLLIEIINNSAAMYLNKTYVLPEEKHTHVIVIAFSLFLVDSYRVDSNGKHHGINLNKLGKRLDFSQLDHILKESEVVNMVGDMSVVPFAYIKDLASFDPSRWPENQSSKLSSSQSSLVMHMSRFKNEYTSLTADLAWHTNITSTRTNEPSVEQNQDLFDLALRGLQCLSSWSVQVLDTFSWKLWHRASHSTNPDCPQNAEYYEMATRYNYSTDERFAMIVLISMIKSTQTQLLRLENFYSDAIRRFIYRELQSLVMNHLNAPLMKLQRKKDSPGIVLIIKAIQTTCGDAFSDQWSASVASAGSVDSHSFIGTLRKNKSSALGTLKRGSGKGASSQALNSFGRHRRVAPSLTQLHLVRNMLESMIDKRASLGKTARKALDPNIVALIESFVKRSFYWPYLLNFNDTLIRCCDLSQLWFREFFLELAGDQTIQFPIEMSLPWIFTNQMLETDRIGFIEHLLYPLDLYNDAADYALNRLQRQFLFDEIEAEASLVLDQLVYKLSDRLFRHYRSYAASILMDKRFRAEAYRVGWREDYPPPNRFAAALLAQHTVQLVGRTIDLTRLLTQRMNMALFKCIKVAIGRFHASDLTGVMELEANLECTRLCHRMLSEHLELDSFENLYNEANERVTSPFGSIALHIFWELTYDVVQNYCYNDATNRFVRTRLSMCEPVKREKMETVEPQYVWGSYSLNTCYESIFNIYRTFIGVPHFCAIVRLLGYRGLYIVFSELMKFAHSLLNQTIRDYVVQLAGSMPSSPVQFDLDSSSMQSDKAYTALYQSLDGIYQWPDLRTLGCQHFREFGNIILVCLQLEKCQSMEDANDLRHAGPFVRQLPKPFIPPLSKAEAAKSDAPQRMQARREAIIKDFREKQETFSVVNVFAQLGATDRLDLAKENEVYTKERLCSGLKLFPFVMDQVKEFLAEVDHDTGISWHCLEPSPDSSINNDFTYQFTNCTQFHRIWSAFQLVFCTPPGPGECTIEEMFGEGLNWAGCFIIFLLDQQRRFELLDFGGHLLRLQRQDHKDVTPEGVSLEKIALRLNRFLVLNRQIFATLNTYRFLCTSEVDAKPITHFTPPN